jgi:hypothetical protein
MTCDELALHYLSSVTKGGQVTLGPWDDIGGIRLPHACFPLVKVFPCVSARRSDVRTGVVAGLNRVVFHVHVSF